MSLSEIRWQRCSASALASLSECQGRRSPPLLAQVRTALATAEIVLAAEVDVVRVDRCAVRPSIFVAVGPVGPLVAGLVVIVVASSTVTTGTATAMGDTAIRNRALVGEGRCLI